MASQSEDTWSVGAGVIVVPKYAGGASTRTRAIPVVTARLKNNVFIDPLRGLGIDKSLGYGLTGSVSIGPELSSRRQADDPRLRGLHNVPEAFALRAGLTYELERLSTDTRVAYRLGSESRRGTVLTQDVSYALLVGPTGVFSAGVSAQFADIKYMNNIFGVTSTEALASGLPQFRPTAGIVSTGPFVQAFYTYNKDWALFARIGENRLIGEAARSPIVVKRTQPLVIATVSRLF